MEVVVVVGLLIEWCKSIWPGSAAPSYDYYYYYYVKTADETTEPDVIEPHIMYIYVIDGRP